MLFTDVLRVQIEPEKIYSDITMLNDKYGTFSEDNFENQIYEANLRLL